eukprot:gene4985-5225_t
MGCVVFLEWQPLMQQAEAYVRQELQHNDGSHDYSHIERVRRTALHLGRLEALDSHSMLVVELSALLHDLKDWKYCGPDEGAGDAIRAFLSSQGQQHALIQSVVDVVSCIGFKEELASGSGGRHVSKEAAVVQDADRLDAIGAVGIARCFTFGGRFNRVLHDPDIAPRLNLTKEQYMAGSANATTINHFYEKLLKIKDLMKTEAGKQVAQQRHAFMEAYLQQFMAEWDGQS